MSSTRTTLLLTNRLRRRTAVAGLLLMVWWLIPFATHAHKQEETPAHHSAHVCAYCAGLQVGAAPQSVELTAPQWSLVSVVDAVFGIRYSARFCHAYRSRAPPGV